MSSNGAAHSSTQAPCDNNNTDNPSIMDPGSEELNLDARNPLTATPLPKIFSYHRRAYEIATRNFLTAAQIADFKGKALFVYGTLMLPSFLAKKLHGDEDVAEHEALALAKRMTPATLHGYRLTTRRDTGYPAITDEFEPDSFSFEDAPEPGVVTGFVIFDLIPAQVGTLDRYEAGLFSREEVRVEIEVLGKPSASAADGRETQPEMVYAYIWGMRKDLLEKTAWSIERFLSYMEKSA